MMHAKWKGLSLIELLVALSIIGLLLSLLLPAVLAARESARKLTCQHHLQQIGLAMHNYEAANKRYPPSFVWSHVTSWSIHGRLLPFLEQSAAASHVRLDLRWHDPINLASGVQTLKVDAYSCPSDPNSDTVCDAGPGEGYVRPLNFGFNVGTWFVYDPRTQSLGSGCFHPNSFFTTSSISDGLCNTLCAAEVKSFQPCILNTATPPRDIPKGLGWINALTGAARFELGPELNDNGGHVEWVDGPVHESGVTTTFGPNQFVQYQHSDGRTYDIDLSSRYEGTSRTIPTFAAVTSRSFHAGLVNVVNMDGSVRSITDSVDLDVWRAMSTRDGNESSAVP